MSEENLPKEWKVLRLGDVCTKPQYGWTSKAIQNGRVRYIRTTDLTKGKIEWSSVPYCEIEPENIEKYQVAKNDILISRAGSVGFSFRIEEVPSNTIFASYLIRFKPVKADPKFIEYFLQSPDYWKSISEVSAGIAVQNINASKLSDLEIPLPPLPEQQRIVAKLDAVFGHLDRVREKLDRIPELLKNFRQQVLTKAVTGELIQEEMEIVSLEEYLEDIKYGTSQKSEYGFEGIPILRIPNIDVEKGLVSLSDLKYSPLDEKEYDKLKLKKGDILIIRSNGSVNLVGQSALIGENEVDFGYAGYLVRLRTSKILDPGYLNYILKSNFLRGQIVEMARSTSGVNNINTSEIKSLKIPFTNIQNQKRITERIEEIFAVTDKIESQYQSLKAKIDNLPQAVLAKAFRGELVAPEVKEYVREIGELGMVAEEVGSTNYRSIIKKS